MKNIVICCDGTWQDASASKNVTTIARIHRLVTLRDESKELQVNYYDSGIGTNGKIDEIFSGYTGQGLDKNIRDAYDFLMTHYEPGDRIFLFGFSRGAYTVRSLAGMVYNVGLLKKEHADKINEGFEIYRSRLDVDKPNSSHSKLFRKSYSREIDISFLGVFDTVGALGIPFCYNTADRYQFHDTTLNPRILCARHANAIDEIRYDFMPTLLGENGVSDIEERAFPGVHSDIGGGYEDSKGLADIPLKWMVDEAIKRGLSINWDYYPKFNPDPAAILHDSYQGVLTKMAGYHRRHYCDKKPGHLFTPDHSFWRKSQYSVAPGTVGQATCPYQHLTIDASFFKRKQSINSYDPQNVELSEQEVRASELGVLAAKS